jgi:hypothetical protein
VGARAFDVLLALIDHRDRIVIKDELLDIAWPRMVVEEGNLQAQISENTWAIVRSRRSRLLKVEVPSAALAELFSDPRAEFPLESSGAPKTNRTSDLPLRRGLLYPLSYRGAAAKLSHAPFALLRTIPRLDPAPGRHAPNDASVTPVIDSPCTARSFLL